MKVKRMDVAGGTSRTSESVGTVDDLLGFLGDLGGGTPVIPFVRDVHSRLIVDCELCIEVVEFGNGNHMVWVAVEAPCALPSVVHATGPADELERAWRDREHAGRCPLAAVTSLVARKSCTRGGCASYGVAECTAKKRLPTHGRPACGGHPAKDTPA